MAGGDVLSAVTTGMGYAATLVTAPTALAIIALRRLAGRPGWMNPLVRWGCAMIPASFGVVIRRHSYHGDSSRHGSSSRHGGSSPHSIRRCTGTTPVILVSNHVNMFDGFILRAALPDALSFRALELESHFAWPVYGTAMRLYGNIPIAHHAPRAALVSLQCARRVLEKSISLLVLPEGHRTRDGALGRFMSGPFRLALETGAPILPVVMAGAYRCKRYGHPRVRPGVVSVRIGEPIGPATGGQLGERELRTLVRETMEQMLRQP